jgi:hypothetical protein
MLVEHPWSGSLAYSRLEEQSLLIIGAFYIPASGARSKHGKQGGGGGTMKTYPPNERLRSDFLLADL